jgi:hypothetical protein
VDDGNNHKHRGDEVFHRRIVRSPRKVCLAPGEVRYRRHSRPNRLAWRLGCQKRLRAARASAADSRRGRSPRTIRR